MTREEAIAELKRDIELDNDFSEEYITAVNMAIKALEQESKLDTLDKIRAEIDRQEKWLMSVGYNAYSAYNVDIAFNSIKSVLSESEEDL